MIKKNNTKYFHKSCSRRKYKPMNKEEMSKGTFNATKQQDKIAKQEAGEIIVCFGGEGPCHRGSKFLFDP